MNRIYKLKYDRRRNQMVAVSELITGAGKESTGQIIALVDSSVFRRLSVTLTPLAFLTGLVMSFLPVMALANPDLPVGGNIVAGQGNISTSGNQMTINQNTHGMVTNWNSFDIGKHNTVQFIQPDSSAIALNRVTGGHESQILGTLTANGQVMLVNPAGVMFGKGAKVNTAGLVASTKNISDADFMAGHYTFSGGGNTGAEVVNQGSLTTTKGGYIVLAADRVKNSGTVRTPGGKTILAAGETVTLQLDNSGLTSVSVKGSVVNALVENRGLLSATDGQVWLTARGKDMLLNTVVNNSGTIEAGGLTRHGGDIVLDGGESGVVSQSGMLLADSDTGRGGNVTLEGQNIHLAAGSQISATGKTGGGEVHVGGGWQGRDSHIRNASKVVMDKSAIVDVSASEKGNGGTAVLWSDDYTDFQGTILAKGGTRSGNGGQVETSSRNNLQAFGDVDASAPGGKGGRWLLDPTDVTIVTDAGNTGISETEQSPEHIFSPVASGAKVSAQKIAEQLNKDTSVTVKTGGVDTEEQKGNITIADGVNITKDAGSGEATLTLLADNNIQVGSNPGGNSITHVTINSTSGKLNLNLLAGNTVNDGSATVVLGKQSTISLNGGDFKVGSALGDAGKINVQAPAADGLNIKANDISITAMGTRGMNSRGLSLTADGNLDISASNISSLSARAFDVNWIAGGHMSVASDGGVTFLANDESTGGKTTLSSGNDINITAKNGTVNINGDGLKSNSGVDISSQHGSITVEADATRKGSTDGVYLNSTSLAASDGNIYITGTTGGERGSDGVAGVKFQGNVNLNSKNNVVKGTSVAEVKQGKTSGVELYDEAHVVFTGDTNIQANSEGYAGFLFNAKYSTGESVEFRNGTATIHAVDKGILASKDPDFDDLGGIAINSWGGKERQIKFNVSDANLNIISESKGKSHGGLISYGLTGDSADERARGSGYIFTGNGDVSVKGTSEKGAGVDLRVLNNQGLDGKFTVVGESDSGTGVIVPEFANVRVANASISGTSNTGVGILINATDRHTRTVDLQGNSLYGSSNSGSSGVQIKGKNVLITSGTIDGVVTSGPGMGVNLAGDTDYKISGATITGKSADGAGVSVSGNLAVNDNASIRGEATNKGSVGVKISGNLQSSGGSHIHGTALSGDGVLISGDTSLSGVSLSGDTGTGTGVNIAGNLNTDENTTVIGTASQDGGDGVSLNGSVTGGKVEGHATDGIAVNITGAVSRSDIHGEATRGTGVAVRKSSQVKDSTVSGNATSGTGVLLESGTTLNTDTVSGLTESGKGVDIAGALVSTGGTDIKGHSTGAGTGINVAGDITGGTVSGTAEGTGTGIRVSGTDVTVSDVVMTGRTEGGTGVSVSGGLTINPSAMVSGLATGNGTGVMMDGRLNGDIHGSSSSGVGIRVSDSTDITQGSNASGHSESGTGAYIEGRVTNQGVIAGESVSGRGVYIDGDVTGGVVSGRSADGVGVETGRDIILSDVVVNGTSATHNGVRVNGHVSNAGSVVISGNSENGAGVSLNGTVSGGALKGHSVSGPGLQVTGESRINGVEVNSSSEHGPGVLMDGTLSSSGSSLNGQHIQDTVVVNAARQTAYQQQGVISHTERQGHAVMASGYQGQDKPVSVEICTDGKCSRLDAGSLAHPVRQ